MAEREKEEERGRQSDTQKSDYGSQTNQGRCGPAPPSARSAVQCVAAAAAHSAHMHNGIQLALGPSLCCGNTKVP